MLDDRGIRRPVKTIRAGGEVDLVLRWISYILYANILVQQKIAAIGQADWLWIIGDGIGWRENAYPRFVGEGETVVTDLAKDPVLSFDPTCQEQAHTVVGQQQRPGHGSGR